MQKCAYCWLTWHMCIATFRESFFWTTWTLKMELIGCLQTSVTNNHLSELRKILEERRSQEVALLSVKHSKTLQWHTCALPVWCTLLALPPNAGISLRYAVYVNSNNIYKILSAPGTIHCPPVQSAALLTYQYRWAF